MIIGGIDIGTSGCKLAAYNEGGEFLSCEYVEYEISRITGNHEINGEDILRGVKEVIKRTVEKTGNIDFLGVSSFGEAFVLLDKDDNILLPSMLYTDPRGRKEAGVFNKDFVIKTVGVKPHEMYSLPKIMWIKNNMPHIYDKTERILLFEDFIIYMLTGNAFIDYSLAARTMGFNIRNLCWDKELFRDAGVDINKMSKPVSGGYAAGFVTQAIEKELGLKGTVIVNGCHDQVVSALGAGALNEGDAVDGTGTVECITPVFNKVPDDLKVYDEGYSIVPFAEKNKYVCYALSFTGGAAIKWFRDNFAKDRSYKELDKEINSLPGDVLVLPHFAGAANPYMDSGSKAAFLGVTLETTRADMYKAVMEGVTYEMRLNLCHLQKAGITFKRLFATGGGAASEIWLQMKADILQLPITAVEAGEAGAMGTAILAAVSAGCFKNLESAVKCFVRYKKTYYPNKNNADIYSRKFEKYKQIYRAVRPLI